jgi:hypothetical protein
LLPHALGIDDEQRRAIARHEMLDRLPGEWILCGIELRLLGSSLR